MKKTKTIKKNKNFLPKGECLFCKEEKNPNFLEVDILNRFTSERGKIQPRSRNGLCAKHQRKLTRAIKRARYLALLPYVVKPE